MEDIVLAIRDLTEEIKTLRGVIEDMGAYDYVEDDYSFLVDDSSTASYRKDSDSTADVS